MRIGGQVQRTRYTVRLAKINTANIALHRGLI